MKYRLELEESILLRTPIWPPWLRNSLEVMEPEGASQVRYGTSEEMRGRILGRVIVLGSKKKGKS